MLKLEELEIRESIGDQGYPRPMNLYSSASREDHSYFLAQDARKDFSGFTRILPGDIFSTPTTLLWAVQVYETENPNGTCSRTAFIWAVNADMIKTAITELKKFCDGECSIGVVTPKRKEVIGYQN